MTSALRDAADEDVGEGLRDVASGQPVARPEPQVGVVVHPEPGEGGEPRVDVAELACVDAVAQHLLHPALVLAAPHPELLRPLAGEGRELRSAERRVGKECGRTCRSWWA